MRHDVSEPVLDVVLELGVEPDRDPVLVEPLAVDESDVDDLRPVEDPHAVVPALAVEVVEATGPLHPEVLADDLAEALAVARIPGRLRVLEQFRCGGAHPFGGELGIVLGSLGGGSLHLRRAGGDLRGARAPCAPAACG